MAATRIDNFLDLVLTNINEVYCEVDEGYFESDHSQILVSVSVPRVVGARVTRSTAYNYRRVDFSALRDALRLLPWNVLNTMSVDGAVDQFYAWVNAAIADHIPTITLKAKFPPWFDGEGKTNLREKDVAHRRMKQSSLPQHKEAFRRCRSRF